MHGRPPPLFEPRVAAEASQGAAHAAPGGLDLDQLLRLLWRRKALILAALLTGLGAAWLVVSAMPERYRATAVLLFAAPGAEAPERAGAGAPAAATGRLLASEIEVLRSRGLLDAVVADQKLLFEPAFNPTLSAGSGLLQRLGLAAPPPAEAYRLSRQRARTRAALQSALQLGVVRNSRAVEIAVTATEPALAARVANAVASVYLARQRAQVRRQQAASTAWLDARVRELRTRVQAADRAVAEYRLSAGLLGGALAGVEAQRIAELDVALLKAQQAETAARARLAQIETLRAGSGAGVASDLPESPLIRELMHEETALLRRRADLATTYGPQHPRMRTVAAELADLRGKIDDEVGRIVQLLRSEVAAARTRRADLARERAAAQNQAGRDSRAQVTLTQLEREAAAERALFDTFLARLKETGLADDPRARPAELISAAEPPLAPSAPNRPLLMALALMVSGTAGLALAFAAEALDRGLRGLGQLEAATGLPALALVPFVRTARGETPSQAALSRPNSAYAEALRTLHTALALSGGGPVRSVMLTSALPGEGKTMLACGLSRVLASGGQRVLLIDADLRHPRVAQELGLAPGPGLAELLRGGGELAGVLQSDPAPATGGRLRVLTAGRAEAGTGLYSAERLTSLVDRLATQFDLVLLDAPPVLAVADPRALAQRVDRTVLLVRWAATPRNTVEHAVRQLRASGVAPAGAVLTRVDLRRQAQYGTGDTGGFAAAGGYYAR